MKLRFNQVLSALLSPPLAVTTLAFASNADREYTSGDLTIVERTVNGAYAGIDEDVTLALVRTDGDRLLYETSRQNATALAFNDKACQKVGRVPTHGSIYLTGDKTVPMVCKAAP